MSINDPRLLTDRNIWLASVRADGRPHLVPIWFVWLNERCYACMQESVKLRNMRANPRVSFALEDGNKPVLAEGLATLHAPPFADELVAAFKQKYNWDITTDPGYNTVIEIEPKKWLKW